MGARRVPLIFRINHADTTSRGDDVTSAHIASIAHSVFADVIGQEHVTVPLSNALESGRTHHAYLFSGPRGCGKTSSARIMARSLNCEKGPTPNPCGECQSCKDLVANGPGFTRCY